MRGNKVDAGIGTPATVRVQIARTGNAISQVAQESSITLPIGTNCIPIAIVPFCPAHGEVSDLISSFAKVPGFGNQLDLREHRILMDDVEESSQAINLMKFAGESGGEVEAEAVHVHLKNPVAQTIHDQLQYTRMPHVQGVSGACVIPVIARIIRHKAVVSAIVDALQRKRGPQMVALGGVVIDNVENHFQSRRMQGLNHGLEFAD